MMGIKMYWRLHKNKILAVSFAAVSEASYIASIIAYGLLVGWVAIFGTFFGILNILLTFIILTMLLVTNIQNDNRAWTAITMIVFLVVWDMVFSLLPGGSSLYVAFTSDVPLLVLGVFLLLSMNATGAFGVVTFIFLYRYRLGRTSYERLILWARLFTGCLAVMSVLQVVLSIMLFGTGPLYVFYAILSDFAVVAAGIAVLFTLRRLRR